ncbi:MAG: hypothetical protein ABIJ47_09080 [Candidatus Bathyarchaeota archaeon]
MEAGVALVAFESLGAGYSLESLGACRPRRPLFAGLSLWSRDSLGALWPRWPLLSLRPW